MISAYPLGHNHLGRTEPHIWHLRPGRRRVYPCRPPLRVRPPGPNLWERPLTIGIGFRFSGGLVLCADSEYTEGYFLKTAGAKIARVPARDCVLIMAGAGDATFMQATFERIRDGLDGVKKTVPAIKKFIESSLVALYARHIYPMPRWDELNFDAQFLMGFRDASGNVELWATQRTHVTEASEYEAIGIGKPLATYLLNALHTSQLDAQEAKILATVVLKEVKAFTPYCGGASTIGLLAGTSELEPRIQHPEETTEIEHAFEQYKAGLAPVTIGALDWRFGDRKFDKVLADFCHRSKELRSRVAESHKIGTLRDLVRGRDTKD